MDLNHRPSPYQSDVLTNWTTHTLIAPEGGLPPIQLAILELFTNIEFVSEVPQVGIEPTTFWFSVRRSDQHMSYRGIESWGNLRADSSPKWNVPLAMQHLPIICCIFLYQILSNHPRKKQLMLVFSQPSCIGSFSTIEKLNHFRLVATPSLYDYS